jgi:hypothetical protein
VRARLVFVLLVAIGCGETLAASNDPDASTDAGADTAPSGDAGADACVDTQADPKNCGRCGHDCLGGACANGKCGPMGLVDWTQTDDRCRDGGPEPCYIGTISGVAVDDTYVYFTDHGYGPSGGDQSGGVLRVRKDVQTPSKAEGVAKWYSVRSVTVDGEFVYWLSKDGSLLRASKAGGAVEFLSTNDSPTQLPHPPVVLGNDVFFGNVSGVRRTAIGSSPDAGSQPAFADAGAVGSVAGVAAGNGGDRLAWITYATTATGVVSVHERDAGITKQVAYGQSAVAVGLEGSVVYWVNGDGSVFRAEVDSPFPVLLAKTDTSPFSLVVADDALYVSTWGPTPNSGQGIVGSVFRVSKQPSTTGEPPEIVYRGPVLVSGLAVDERAIYFGAWFAPTVFRIAR